MIWGEQRGEEKWEVIVFFVFWVIISFFHCEIYYLFIVK